MLPPTHILQIDLDREIARNRYLERMIRTHAEHIWSDVSRTLESDYPTAQSRGSVEQ